MAQHQLGAVLKRKGISKRQLAIRLGVPYYSVFRWFRSGYDPKLSTLTRWSKVLNCKVRDLIKE